MTRLADQPDIRLKRAYEPTSANDGARVLVDRLWPRGVTKAKAAIEHWFREIAPSAELRKWFGHDVTRWDEFQRRYAAELNGHVDLLDELCALARRGPVTLIYAARDEEHNGAIVLKQAILKRWNGAGLSRSRGSK
jgi:uncharacterized protein YeaO (DUF488 family)